MQEDGYHLVGVAGVGMSALAQVLLHRGCAVSGSDRQCDRGEDSDTIAKLRGAGVRLVRQDGRGVTRETAAVVVSTAVEKDNPDLLAAGALKVPVVHRAEMLARLADAAQCVAVTGTSGKSTVTGMIGWMLERMEADPTVVNGAPLLNWMTRDRIGNVRMGRSDLWVIEADESDGSVLQYHPRWAVITNISKDHFELDEVRDLFRRFRLQVKEAVVGPMDETEPEDGFCSERWGGGTRFTYKGERFDVPLPGAHNAENAFLAVTLCERIGFPLDGLARALASFRGICRRLETVGTARGVTVVDDYAHNPAKIRAAWQAVAPSARRVLAVWRPHGFGPLALMLNELADAFRQLLRPADRLFVLPVYDAGGTADRSVRSEMLVERLGGKPGQAMAVCRPEEALAAIRREAAPGDVVLVMGARDPGLPELARRALEEIRGAAPRQATAVPDDRG